MAEDPIGVLLPYCGFLLIQAICVALFTSALPATSVSDFVLNGLFTWGVTMVVGSPLRALAIKWAGNQLGLSTVLSTRMVSFYLAVLLSSAIQAVCLLLPVGLGIGISYWFAAHNNPTLAAIALGAGAFLGVIFWIFGRILLAYAPAEALYGSNLGIMAIPNALSTVSRDPVGSIGIVTFAELLSAVGTATIILAPPSLAYLDLTLLYRWHQISEGSVSA